MSKISHWTPLVLASMIAFTASIESLGDNKRFLMFFGSLPMIFYFITISLQKLQKENDELRARLDALEGKETTEEMPENRAFVHR
ncbi:hypothetical protein [Gimesia sp.]|uniref:hypothetical protein n=1 Tax=Gimesia sp. TaxID=2024833 RepID=UPI003A958DE8